MCGTRHLGGYFPCGWGGYLQESQVKVLDREGIFITFVK